MVGLRFRAFRIRASRASERNRVHHWPGISFSLTKRWAAPPAPVAEAVVPARGSGVYPCTEGASGGRKSGPTAHPAARAHRINMKVVFVILMRLSPWRHSLPPDGIDTVEQLRDSEQTNIPFYISSSDHLCRPFNHKILDVALLRLRFCSIRNDKSGPNLSVKPGISASSESLRPETVQQPVQHCLRQRHGSYEREILGKDGRSDHTVHGGP